MFNHHYIIHLIYDKYWRNHVHTCAIRHLRMRIIFRLVAPPICRVWAAVVVIQRLNAELVAVVTDRGTVDGLLAVAAVDGAVIRRLQLAANCKYTFMQTLC